jgi:hypothetical protein
MADTNWGYYSIDPSRSTPDGSVLLFESRAPLTGYDPEGHTEVYRYDYEGLSLSCLSCNPTGVAATDDAHLQTVDVFNLSYLSHYNAVNNLRADGKRAFFESEEALVLNDTDGLRDVYEWEDEGVGSCQEQGGCVRLVSSGSSGHDDLLFAVSDSGNDVFIRSADLLSAADPDETPSIYDARVGGGFPPPPTQPGECLGEACQPAASAPDDATPASAAFPGAGNVKGTPPATGKGRCRKGKRGVARASQRRCATKRQHKKSQKRRSGAKRGAK